MLPTMKRFASAFSILLFSLFAAAPAGAQDENTPVRYVVQKGDTLIALGNRYFLTAQTYKIVQRQNRIADPYRIPVGKILAIPRNLLKFRAGSAELISVRGQVSTDNGDASTGQKLQEGAAITTGPSSFVTMILDDGSRVSLPSNSSVRIIKLRTYVLGNLLDYDFDVAKGGMRSSVIKQRSTDDRYRVRTPKAVSAVRGTDFQSRFDPDTKNDFAEVVEGGLSVVAGNGASRSVPAGNGLAVTADGGVISEALLGPPALQEPGRLQAENAVRFSTLQASAVRYTIATDASFIEQVADRIAPDGTAEFLDLPDGNYFLRARAISSTGLQGMPATFTFKRRLNSITASAQSEDQGFAFRWRGEGKGTQLYHFQLFRSAINTVAMVDQSGLKESMINLSDLPVGDYFWRVGSIQFVDGEVSTSWTPFEKITVSGP